MDVRGVGQARRRAGRVVRDLPDNGARHVVGDVAAANHDDVAPDVEGLTERHSAQ